LALRQEPVGMSTGRPYTRRGPLAMRAMRHALIRDNSRQRNTLRQIAAIQIVVAERQRPAQYFSWRS